MKTSAVIGLVSAFVASVLSAHAADQKSLPGAICKPTDAAYEDFEYWASSGIVKLTNNLGYVTCPMMRDRSQASDTLQTVAVEAYNMDSGTNPTYMSCALYTLTEDFSGLPYVDYELRETNSAGFWQANFYAEDITVSSGNEGSFALLCRIGEDDSVKSIYWKENGGTD